MTRAVPLLALLGCSEMSLKGDAGGFRDTATGTATTIDTGNSTEVAVPTWYHFDATLEVTGGVPSVPGGTVTATVHDADGAAMCAHAVPVVSIEAIPRPAADRDLLAWWRVELGEGTPDVPCAPFAARTVWWGVGPWDPALDPARVSAGLADATANAAVMREQEAGPSWLVGLAGTDDQLAGYAPPATARPLPDGTWEWVGLILLSW